jgi:hypothetical protein
MRLMVKTGLRRLWRDPTTLQLGVDPEHAVVLAGIGSGETRLLGLLDGTRDTDGVVRAASAYGVSDRQARALVRTLHAADALDDANGAVELGGLVGGAEAARLRPDLAALELVHRTPGTASLVLRARRERVVRVRGAGRVGAQLGALLAAAGVGTVALDDSAAARASEVAPGGLHGRDLGAPREVGARRAVHAAAPSAHTDVAPGASIDLVVLADEPAPPSARAGLLTSGTPHLYAGVRETTGVVGPLVLVGRSACLRCIDLTRADRDHAWPWIAAQLAVPHRGGPDACDIVLATTVAALAAREALAFLDTLAGADTQPDTEPAGAGSTAPQPATVSGNTPQAATVGGTLELKMTDWRLRRRSWAMHPSCGCHWTE